MSAIVMPWCRVRGLESRLLIVAVLCAVVGPARADFQPVLVYGDTVPKLGRVRVPNLGNGDGPQGRACLSEHGAIVTRSQADSDVTGLVCIDGDGARAIVRAGDPAPGGGVFAFFYECQFVGANEVLFTAFRRRTLTSGDGDYAVYRAGPNGLERVVAAAELVDPLLQPLGSPPPISFAADTNGELAVRVFSDIGATLFVGRDDRYWQQIIDYRADIWDFALFDRGDVIFASTLEDYRRAILVWRDGTLRVLTQEGDVSPTGAVYDSFELWERRGDRAIFFAYQYTPFRRELLLYDALDGSLRTIDEADPAWASAAAAIQLSAQFDSLNDDDVTLLEYNSAGSVLIVSEDPGSGDLLVNQLPTISECPPNDQLSDTPPVLPTLVPTPAPPTPSPTPTRPPADPITLEVVADQGAPGEELDFRVILHSRRADVAGVQIDIGADAPLTFSDQAPTCTRNPAIGKDVFSSPGGGSELRALVLSLTNADPIPDGSVLFSCRLRVAADAAPGRHQLRLFNLGGGSVEGEAIDAIGSGGTVTIVDPDTRAVEPDAEMSSTGSGGCNIGGEREPGNAVVLLVIAAMLVAWRWRIRGITHRTDPN